VCSLDVTTNFLGVNKSLANQDVMNFYATNLVDLQNDPAIGDLFPDGLIV
jgi:hypothetical protein